MKTIVAVLASRRVRPYVLVGAGLALLVAFHAWSLMRYPAPFVDEAWYASRSWGLITSGKAFGMLDAGVFDRYPGYWTYFQWVPVALQAVVVRLSGAPDLVALRALSLGVGLLLAAAVFSIAESVADRRLAALSTFLLLVSQAFLYSAHMARYDVMSSACGYWAIAIHLRNRRRSFWVALAVGLLLGLGFEIHPLAAVFAPALVALFLIEDGRGVFRDRRLWGVFVGGVAGLAVYLLLHVVPYPATFSGLTGLVYGPTHTPPIATGDLRLWLMGLVDEVGLLFFAYLFGLLAILLGIVRLSFGPSRPARWILTLALAMIFSHTLLVRNKLFYYAILVTPSIDLLLASYLLEEYQRARAGRILSRVGFGISVFALALSAFFYLLPLRIDQYQVYRQVQLRINSDVRSDDALMGSQTYWFGLHEHTYYSWEQLVYFRRYAPDASLALAMAEFRPDVFVLDGHIREYLVEGSEGALYSGLLTIPKDELGAILGSRGALVDAFDGGTYGLIQIYRLDWSATRLPPTVVASRTTRAVGLSGPTAARSEAR